MPSTSRVVHAAPGPDPDEDRRGALLHQHVRGLGVGRVADGDRDRHEPREVRERERLVAGREVAGRRDLRLDEEQVRAVLGAERPEPAGDARASPTTAAFEPAACSSSIRRAISSSRIGGAYASASTSWTCVVGRGGDPLEDLGRVVVARLDALEVEDREPAEARQLAGRAARPRRRPSPRRAPGCRGRCRRTTGRGRRRRDRSCRCPARARRPRSRTSVRIVSTFERKMRRFASVSVKASSSRAPREPAGWRPV